MTPEEELARLNRLISQYATVYRTTTDPDQKERVERQVKELRSYRDKLLAVNVIENTEVEQPEEEDELAAFPLLETLRAENVALPYGDALESVAAKGANPTASQEEVFNLSLYARRFEREFLPFLTEKKLKLDFKYSMDRDAFYSPLQALQRRIVDYRQETRRLAEGAVNREMEMETKKRTGKMARLLSVEGARLFRGLQHFAADLEEDADGDGVKCLNADDTIQFDRVEGTRQLEGLSVREALRELGALAEEAVSYLNVPDIEGQETGRADRH
jgi:hypothetical protein